MVEYEFFSVQRFFSSISSIDGFILGLEPFGSVDVVQRSEGELIQGGKIGEESAVYHRKYEGKLRLYPQPAFFFKEASVEGIPPILCCKPTEASTVITIGSGIIPHDGSISLWKHPHGFYVGGVWNGFRLQVLNGGYFDQFWFTDNYLLQQRSSISIDFARTESEAFSLFKSLPSIGSTSTPSPYGSPDLKLYVQGIVGDDAHTVMPYVLPDWPVKDRYPKLPNMLELWSDLTQSAVDSLDALDINSIAFFKELGEWRRLLPPLPRTWKGLTSLKTWSNFYLWLRYGLVLSMSDAKKIITSLPKLRDSYKQARTSKKTRLRASRVVQVEMNAETWTCRLGLRILLDTFPDFAKSFGKFADRLNSLDLYPNLANLWDLIPYSFVLDWFIPVQQWLEEIDTQIRALNFQIYCITQSMKWSRTVPPPYVPGYVTTDSLSEVHYIRSVGTDLPSPTFEWKKTGDNPTTSYTIFKRVADGIALLIQRVG